VKLKWLKGGMFSPDTSISPKVKPRLCGVTLTGSSPRPCVAKPYCWKDVERCGHRTAIVGRYSYENIVCGCFCVFNEDIKVAIVGEGAGICDLKLAVAPPSILIFLKEARVGKCSLRILVKALHVGVRGNSSEIIVTLLDVLSVVALRTGESEQTLLEDYIRTIPK
jgi:hypothetical protein